VPAEAGFWSDVLEQHPVGRELPLTPVGALGHATGVSRSQQLDGEGVKAKD